MRRKTPAGTFLEGHYRETYVDFPFFEGADGEMTLAIEKVLDTLEQRTEEPGRYQLDRRSIELLPLLVSDRRYR
jgi:hypothetical protein